MLLIRGPYGEGSGHGLSLIRDMPAPSLGLEDTAFLTMVLRQHGVWGPAIPKIISCMNASGRYDCRVTTSVLAQTPHLTRDLATIGIRPLWDPYDPYVNDYYRALGHKNVLLAYKLERLRYWHNAPSP